MRLNCVPSAPLHTDALHPNETDQRRSAPTHRLEFKSVEVTKKRKVKKLIVCRNVKIELN